MEKFYEFGLDQQWEMEMSRKSVMFAYVDDIVVMGETREEVFKITDELLKASLSMGLSVN